jgi:hypothetical protein
MWNLFKHYRPERHYMRGPGAKWYDTNALPTSSLSEKKLELPYSSWLIPAAAITLLVVVTALSLG